MRLTGRKLYPLNCFKTNGLRNPFAWKGKFFGKFSMNTYCYCWVQRYGFSLTIRKSETIFFLTGWMCVYFYKGLHKWNNIQWFAYWHGWKAKGVIFANSWSLFCRCRLDARQAKNKGCVSSVSKMKKIRVRGVRLARLPHIYFTQNFQFRFSELLKLVLFACILLNINALFCSRHEKLIFIHLLQIIVFFILLFLFTLHIVIFNFFIR